MLFRGEDLLKASTAACATVRGDEIAMIFQDPMTSLNPVHKIGRQLAEAVVLHNDVSRKQAYDRALELLKAVGIPRAERRIDDYPHQFSGGMRQRVMIAMALINNPDLIIADEPTTALDVTTQAQILALLKRLQEDFGSAVIMITHDLGVVAETADDVIVMYAARIVERGPVRSIFNEPRHPYTWGLMGSLPRLDVNLERLYQIPGQPPSLLNPPSGCRFHPRCAFAMPDLPAAGPAAHGRRQRHASHEQACHLDEETKAREAAKLVATLTAGSALVSTAANGQRAPRRRGPEEALPDHARDRVPEGDRDREGGRRRLVHRCARARRSGSSASRAAASRRSSAASSSCSSRQAAGSSSRARTSRASPGATCARCGAT